MLNSKITSLGRNMYRMESVHVVDKNQTMHNDLEVEYMFLTVKKIVHMCVHNLGLDIAVLT